ncbi:hypothetical protein LEN26_014760 [Aphanomyces euteiches]|nr:hypothetical protein LEN26_014760 [Aphanomyces euteiches]KAH9110229.1 hypothetical protein AeMF1_014901 [Aphanomyces euteiches]KAH9181479.1 hypothetical protein AeNC1_016546 [Aphanomyces euteiches]
MKQFFSGTWIGDSFAAEDKTLWLILWHQDGSMYETTRNASDKPRALTCSGDEYLAVIHDTFHLGHSLVTLSNPVVENDQLVVELREERDGMNLRYDSWTMRLASPKDQRTVREKWCGAFADEAQQRRDLVRRVADLETLIKQKESLLHDAIQAKVDTEKQLVLQCVELINTKKQHIERLQNSLPKANKRKQPERGEEEDEEEDEGSAAEEEDDDEVVEAASQAYSHVPSQSTHISAKRLLKQEEDDDFLNML